MIKVVHINDLHFGLVTEGIDRAAEIVDVSRRAIKRAVKLQKDGHKVYFVIGGDVFNTNTPSEKHIKMFIGGILNPLKKFNIETFVVAGNHDSIADPKRLSCLGFLHSISKVYNNVTLFEDMATKKITTTDYGDLNFIFLPHIHRAHLDIDDRNDDYANTQDYIEEWAKATKESIGKGTINYVFSHLNVRGAHGGSEENLLKKSESYLPEAFLFDDKGWVRPQIIQSHIHSNDVLGNINIVGSQIFCGFGEAEKVKYFMELSIPTSMNEKEEIKLIDSKCTQFRQLDIDLTIDSWDGISFLNHKPVAEFISSIKPEPCVLKFNPLVNPSKSSVNWEEVRLDIQKLGKGLWTVKPIVPKFVHNRVLRSSNQKIGLPPDEAVKVFLKNNKPSRAKNKWRLAKNYL